MKKILVLMTLLFSQQSFSAETIKLVVGESFAPLMWKDKDGSIRGIAVELGKAIFEKAGYNVVIEACPWVRCQVIAENEGAFITGFSKNDERIKRYYYTEPILYDEVIIVTKKGKDFPFHKNEDVKGKRIGSQTGSGFGTRFEELKKIYKPDYDHNDVARVKKIDADRIDAGVFSLGKAGFEYSAKLAGFNPADFVILPEIIAKDPNFMATGVKTPNAKEKMDKINAAIKALWADGTLDKIIKKTY